MTARFKHLLHGNFLRDDVVKVFEEAVFLAGIQLDGAEYVGELEAVDDHAGIVGESAGLDDVHAPGSQRAGHIGKQPAAVARDHGEIEELAVGAKIELDGVLVEIGGELKVVADVLGEAGLQVALRKAFEELSQVIVLRRRHHGSNAIQQGWDRWLRGSGPRPRCDP